MNLSLSKNNDLVYLVGLIILSLIALIPLFSPGFFGYDFIYQGARLASFYKNLQEGVILPRWAGQLNAGFGHPVLIFLYPFVFYLGSFWHFLGFSLVDSIKIILGLGFIFSGVFMYLALSQLWKKPIAFLGSLLYLFSPFHFVNLYERAALGEHLGTCFLPLIFLGLVKIFKNPRPKLINGVFLGVGLALTIVSHNLIILLASSLLVAFFVYLLSLYGAKDRSQKIKLTILGVLLGLALSSFFWVPIVFERKYTRYDEIANPIYYQISLLPPIQIFTTPNYKFLNTSFRPTGGVYIFPTVSPIQWLLVIGGLYFIARSWSKKKREAVLVLFIILYFIFGAYLATNLSFWLVKLIPPIAFFQQACRFLNLPLFATPFLLAILLTNLPKKYFNLLFLLILIFNLAANLPYFWNLQIPREFKNDEYFFQVYKLTADTGQITPRWSLINYYDPAFQKVQLVSGGIDNINIMRWDSQAHFYTLKLREASQIADNTLYFPGWEVLVDGQLVPLNFQDMNWRGIITYPVPAGEHQIVAKFTETKLRLVGDYLSLTALIFTLLFFIFESFKYFHRVMFSK